MEYERSPMAVIPKSENTGWTESIVLRALQTSIGQTVFKLIDSFLWIIEKSAQWSLPAHEVVAEENGKMFGRIEFVRPLPWIFFLPSLVIIRVIRIGLNIGAFVLGYPQIQPSGIVKFMQKSRRRFRSVNLKAIKSARRKTSTVKDKRLTMVEAKKALIRSIRLTISALSCLDVSKSSPSPPPTKIRISGMDLEMVPTPDEKSTTESTGSPVNIEMKRKFSQVITSSSSDESDHETLQSKIDRLAQGGSTDDSDFNPTECNIESSSTSSDDEESMHVSVDELQDIQKDAKEPFHAVNNQEDNIHSFEQTTNDNEVKDSPSIIDLADSPESNVQPVSRVTNDFINGEINSSAQAPPAATSSKQEVTKVIGNRKAQTSGARPRSRGSISKKYTPVAQDKKQSPRKRGGRYSK